MSDEKQLTLLESDIRVAWMKKESYKCESDLRVAWMMKKESYESDEWWKAAHFAREWYERGGSEGPVSVDTAANKKLFPLKLFHRPHQLFSLQKLHQILMKILHTLSTLKKNHYSSITKIHNKKYLNIWHLRFDTGSDIWDLRFDFWLLILTFSAGKKNCD